MPFYLFFNEKIKILYYNIKKNAIVAQSVEHYIGNVEVMGSIPVVSSIYCKSIYTLAFFNLIIKSLYIY